MVQKPIFDVRTMFTGLRERERESERERERERWNERVRKMERELHAHASRKCRRALSVPHSVSHHAGLLY